MHVYKRYKLKRFSVFIPMLIGKYLFSLAYDHNRICVNKRDVLLMDSWRFIVPHKFLPGFSLTLLKSPARKQGLTAGLGDLQKDSGLASGKIGILSERLTGSGRTRKAPVFAILSRRLSASSQLAP